MAQFLLSAFADEADTSLQGQIDALRRNGIYNLEPRNVGGAILEKTTDELKEIRKTLDANGIGVPSLGSPIGKVGIREDFEAYLPTFGKALDACRILGAKRMRVFSFFVGQEELSECRDEVLRRMNVLLDLAEEAGVTLCHENESKIYGQNPPEVRDLLRSLPRLEGVFDAANFVMNGQDPMEGFEATLPRLGYLHVKDASFAQRCIQPVGMGDGRYEEILRRVDRATDRTVLLTLEPHLHIFEIFNKIDAHSALRTGIDFSDSDEAFDYAAAALKNLLTKIGCSEGEDHLWRK